MAAQLSNSNYCSHWWCAHQIAFSANLNWRAAWSTNRKIQAEFESRAKKAKLAGKFEPWNNTLSLSGFGDEKASSRPPTPEKRETTGRFLEACANFLNVRIMFLDTKPTSLGDSIWKHLREAVSIHATSFRLRPATRQPCMTMTQRHASKQASGKESGRQMSTQPEKYSPLQGWCTFRDFAQDPSSDPDTPSKSESGWPSPGTRPLRWNKQEKT